MKTLGQVAYEAKWGDCEGFKSERVHATWQAVADAVVQAHEARQWIPIAEFGEEQIQSTVGRYTDGEWKTWTGFLYLPYWASRGWTHVLLRPNIPPPPPKEADDAVVL